MLHAKTLLIASCLLAASIANAQTAYEQAAETTWNVVNLKDEEAFKSQLDEAAELSDQVGKARDSQQAIQSFIDASGIAKETRTELLKMVNPEATESQSAIEGMLKPGMTYIFVSQSMPEQLLSTLYQVFETTPDDGRVEIVFRGLEPDQRSVSQMMREIWKFISDKGLKPEVSITLNPTLFRELDVTSVPQIAHIMPDGEVARVKGMLNHHFFLAQLDDAESLDLGVQGELFPISERSLIEIIQERIAGIDWDQKKRNAINSFWRNYRYEALPPASEPKSFYADMRVLVANDIPDGRGGLIARKGELINPFESVAGMTNYNRRVIVFDPNHSSQLHWAKYQVEEALKRNERPVPMLTNIVQGDIETFPKVERYLKTQIYLLIPEAVKRFSLSEAPALVTRSKIKPSSMLVQVFACNDGSGLCHVEPLPQGEL